MPGSSRVPPHRGDPHYDRPLGQDCGNSVGMGTVGFSAPCKDLLTKFGFMPAKVLAAAKDQIMEARGQNA